MESVSSPQPSTSKNAVEFNIFRENKKDSHSPSRQNGSDKKSLNISIKMKHKKLHKPSSVLEENHLQLMKLINFTDLDSEHAHQLVKRVCVFFYKTCILYRIYNIVF